MTTITEGRQRLDFDASWGAVQWDLCPEYKGSMETAFSNLPGTRSVKAADVVAVRRVRGLAPVLLVAEFKDYHRPQLPRDEQQEIARNAVSDVVQASVVGKVIDSLAGAAFARDAAGGRHQVFERWRSTVGLKSAQLLVLLCVEMPPSQALVTSPWNTALKHRLDWLHPNARVVVTGSQRPFAGLGISYGLVP